MCSVWELTWLFSTLDLRETIYNNTRILSTNVWHFLFDFQVSRRNLCCVTNLEMRSRKSTGAGYLVRTMLRYFTDTNKFTVNTWKRNLFTIGCASDVQRLRLEWNFRKCLIRRREFKSYCSYSILISILEFTSVGLICTSLHKLGLRGQLPLLIQSYLHYRSYQSKNCISPTHTSQSGQRRPPGLTHLWVAPCSWLQSMKSQKLSNPLWNPFFLLMTWVSIFAQQPSTRPPHPSSFNKSHP